MNGWFAGVCLVLALVFNSGAARADGLDSGLEKLVTSINDATGPEAYVYVREIWGKWADSDPRAVEAVLDGLAHEERLDRGLRDYAAFFAAHARTRVGDLLGAQRGVRDLGFVGEWMVVGPFANEGKSGLQTEFGPEAQLTESLVPGRAYSGKERAVRWRVLPEEISALGWLNGASLFRPEQNICFYARTYFEVPKDLRADVHAGVRGAYRLYVDGRVVHEEAAYRGHDIDRNAIGLFLGKGRHSLTVKACGADAAPIVSVRVAPQGGDRAKFTASFIASERTNEQRGASRVLAKDHGPLARFQATLAAPRATPAQAYDFARYLVLTEGDDPALHEARDLARSAAERAPGVAHLLLAGELAEDDNEQRLWLERAEALPSSPAEQLEVLLSRAALERRSVDWRRAAGLYRSAIALAPDDSRALIGHAEVLSRSGLPRSALGSVEAALARHPYRVNLLNLYASQLHGLGLVRAAREAEERYALFRADDAEYLSARLATALARDDRAGAEHWAARMREFKPDSHWVASQVADAFLALGQPERAAAELERALELAPHDVGLLRALADLHGRTGQRDEQLLVLERILELRPQASDVEQYVEFLQPRAPRLDESFAVSADEFLKRRTAAAKGESQRNLVDLTVKTVFENGLSHEFRQLVFQPLSDVAAAMARNYTFHFEGASQRVQLRGARVYRTDGRVDRAIETGIGPADDPRVAMYTSARTYNVQFPRLEAGDVVELSYRIEEVVGRNELNDYFGDVHYFHSTESTAHSEYILVTPKERRFYVDTHTLEGLRTDERLEGPLRISRYWLDDLAPISGEPHMPAWPEVAPFLHVSTYASYQELGRWYWGLVRDQFDVDDRTKRLVHDLTDALPSVREKVAAVYGWVIRNTRYVALEFGIYGIKPRRCVQTVARGWGDCKDKATVIVSLLREIGIEASFVLVRTQHRGRFDSSVASLAPFDHAIAYIPALDLYLDGTAEATGIGELPEMDQGAIALQVRQGASALVTLPTLPPDQNRDARKIDVRLDNDGGGRLHFDFEISGVRASEWRRRFGGVSTQRDRLAAELHPMFPGLSLESAGLHMELVDFEKPVRASASGHAPRLLRDEGSVRSLAVTWPGSLVGALASTASRRLPVAIGAFGSVDYTYVVELPASMGVVGMPQESHVESRFGEVRVHAVQAGRSVTVQSSVVLSVQRVSSEDYTEFRNFCVAADAALAQRLVVSR